MSAMPYEVSLISIAGKATRTVIAASSVQAIRAALPSFDEPESSFALTCTRLGALPDIEEQQPCAA